MEKTAINIILVNSNNLNFTIGNRELVHPTNKGRVDIHKELIS